MPHYYVHAKPSRFLYCIFFLLIIQQSNAQSSSGNVFLPRGNGGGNVFYSSRSSIGARSNTLSSNVFVRGNNGIATYGGTVKVDSTSPGTPGGTATVDNTSTPLDGALIVFIAFVIGYKVRMMYRINYRHTKNCS